MLEETRGLRVLLCRLQMWRIANVASYFDISIRILQNLYFINRLVQNVRKSHIYKSVFFAVKSSKHFYWATHRKFCCKKYLSPDTQRLCFKTYLSLCVCFNNT